MPIDLFISHSWAYGDAYEKLTNMLDSAQNFYYTDHSVPKDDPIHFADNDQELATAIYQRMQPARIVLVLAGVYATYSKWIDVEMRLAASGFSVAKPIVAIQPWGAEKTSKPVKDNATCVVGWNTNSIVQAIRELE